MQPLHGDPGAVAAREEALVSAQRGLGDRLLEETQHACTSSLRGGRRCSMSNTSKCEDASDSRNLPTTSGDRSGVSGPPPSPRRALRMPGH